MANGFQIISGGARLTQSVCDGLLRGEMPILYGHSLFPYAGGSHEQIYDGGEMVGMYVSFCYFLYPLRDNIFNKECKGNEKN
jgi:hypothetical protein